MQVTSDTSRCRLSSLKVSIRKVARAERMRQSTAWARTAFSPAQLRARIQTCLQFSLRQRSSAQQVSR